MPRYQVKGTVWLTVTSTERVRIDEVYEVANEDIARQKALDYAEESQWGDDIEIDDDDLEMVCLDDLPEVEEAIEAKATYAWMKAQNAPTLFDTEE